MATEVASIAPIPDSSDPSARNASTPRVFRARATSFDSPTTSSLNRIKARLVRTEPEPDPRSSRTFITSTAPKRTTGVRRKAVSSAPAKKAAKVAPAPKPEPKPVAEVNSSNVNPPDPDKTFFLQEENAKLKLKVAALEAYQALEYDDPDKLGKVRLRVLKAQNLQLERQLVLASISTSSARKIKATVSLALKDLKSKIAELQKAERLPEPASAKPEPTKSPVIKRTTSVPRTSRSSLSSKPTPTSKSANVQPWKSGSSRSTVTPKVNVARRSPFAPDSDPASRRSTFNSAKSSNLLSRSAPKTTQPAVAPPEPSPPPPPPPPPKVAIGLDWVEEMEKWTNSLLERLAKPLTNLDPKSLNKDVEKPKSDETKEGEAGTSSEIQPSDQNTEKQESKDEAKVDELFDPVAASEFLPFIPGAGNRFLAQSNDKSSTSVPISLSLLSEESLPLIQYSHIHGLEDRLAKLHPKMIRLAGLLRSMLLPSLPTSTTASIQKEVRTIDFEIFEAAKALGELVLLVPGKGSLLGSNASKSAAAAASQQRKEVEISSIIQKEAEEEARRARREEDDQWTSRYGDAFRVKDKDKEKVEKKAYVSEVPEFEEFLASLPPLGDGEDAAKAKRLIQSLLEKFRKLEAVWHSEKVGLNEEMEFYKGCHTVQATHMKQIMSAGRDALESVVNYGLEIASSSSSALNQILDALRDYHQAQSQDSLNHLLNQLENGLPSLQQYVDLVPPKFQNSEVKSKTNSIMDPLEEEYKDRLKALFGGLQSRRASLFSKGSHSNSPSHSKAPSFARKSFPEFPKPVW